jgi:RHS repeat-associated protein
MKKIIAFIVICFFFLSLHNPVYANSSYTFTDQEQDTSGLYYYNARYYDPDLSRFISADSVDTFAISNDPQSLNRYSYVRNNPVNRVDPSGNVDYSVITEEFIANEPIWITGGIDNPFATDTIVHGLMNEGQSLIQSSGIEFGYGIESNLYTSAAAKSLGVSEEYLDIADRRRRQTERFIINTYPDQALKAIGGGEARLGALDQFSILPGVGVVSATGSTLMKSAHLFKFTKLLKEQVKTPVTNLYPTYSHCCTWYAQQSLLKMQALGAKEGAGTIISISGKTMIPGHRAHVFSRGGRLFVNEFSDMGYILGHKSGLWTMTGDSITIPYTTWLKAVNMVEPGIIESIKISSKIAH